MWGVDRKRLTQVTGWGDRMERTYAAPTDRPAPVFRQPARFPPRDPQQVAPTAGYFGDCAVCGAERHGRLGQDGSVCGRKRSLVTGISVAQRDFLARCLERRAGADRSGGLPGGLHRLGDGGRRAWSTSRWGWMAKPCAGVGAV